MTGKVATRSALRARRHAHVGGIGARLSALTEEMAARIDAACGRAACVAGYIAQPDEVDVLPALRRAHARSRATVLPHVTARVRPMRFLAWAPGGPLEKGYFGLLQPPADAAALEPDLLLTPLLGFDRALGRLGQGAGFYDRWFAAHPSAFRLGVAWSAQEVEAVARDPWDMPLHAVITEREWIGARP